MTGCGIGEAVEGGQGQEREQKEEDGKRRRDLGLPAHGMILLRVCMDR
jgi:hypothetical protein